MHFIDFIDIEEQYIDVYIYTKDKRMIVVKDMVSDVYIDDYQVSMDHMSLGQRTSFVMLREDFSHLEYIIKDRNPKKFDHKKEFDDINSFIDDEIGDDSITMRQADDTLTKLTDLLTEPTNDLTDDLI